MLQTVSVKKVDEKLGSFVKFPYVFPELWSLNCPKKCILQFCADLSKKTKFVKAI